MEAQTQEAFAPMTNVEIADTYVEAWNARDLEKAMFAPDVVWQIPLTPRKIVGRDNVLDYMRSLLPGIDDIKIERHLEDRGYVVTLGEAHTVWGTIPTCWLFKISHGTIVEVRSFYDPRPIVDRH